jgi:arylsulfatase
MILVDDLGYTDLGAFGGNIATPSIDSLATEGMVFSNAHAYPSCAPTRASLITGKDPHRVGLGSQNGVAPPGVPPNTPGYKGSLEGDYVAISEVLGKGGFETYQVGKWHLGYEPHQAPGALGFDRHFTLLDGAASHYSDRTGVGLSVSPSGAASYIENGRPVESLPPDFYSTQFYTQWLIDALSDRSSEDKPFFAYLAYTAVHDPLHAPEELISQYVELFESGFRDLKSERTRGLAERGLIEDASVPTRWLADTPSWDELSPRQKTDSIRRMAVHAAMLDYVDTEIGRVIQQLKSSGEYDNTLIVVMSDNGAATVPRTFYAGSAQELQWQDEAYPLQAVVDYGKEGSFATLGTYNAQAISGPYFGFKTSLYEGGTRVPMIVKVPGRAVSSISYQFAHISDLYRTFADYAGIDTDNQEGLIGCSLKPLLEGESVDDCHEEFGMGYMGWRSYRSHPWKLVFVSESFGGTGSYALYDLEKDPGEVYDLSAQYPDIVIELSQKWSKYAEANGIAEVPMEPVNQVFDRASSRFFDLFWGQ